MSNDFKAEVKKEAKYQMYPTKNWKKRRKIKIGRKTYQNAKRI